MRDFFRSKYGAEKGSVWTTITIRASALPLLGIMPAILMLKFSGLSLSEMGLSMDIGEKGLLWTAIASVIIIPSSFFFSKQEKNLSQYPQIRCRQWPLSTILLSSLSWMLYLFPYEFLFRGVLLFAAEHELGYWPAVVLTTVIYSFAHYLKNTKEVVGSTIIGTLLAIATLNTGSIWTAFLIHSVMAISNDLFSFFHHPEMKFVK